MRKFGAEISNLTSPPACLARSSLKNCHSPPSHNVSSLLANEITIKLDLSLDERKSREILLKWLMAHCKLTLELNSSTVEHCIRLYDYYCAQSPLLSRNFEEMQLDILSCLFISSKYEEVYPPNTSDFEYVSKYRFSTADILSREVHILSQIDYKLVIPLASHWYYALYGQSAPEWLLLCYTMISPKTSMKSLAQAAFLE